jgi:hypothetical protein
MLPVRSPLALFAANASAVRTGDAMLTACARPWHRAHSGTVAVPPRDFGTTWWSFSDAAPHSKHGNVTTAPSATQA